MLCLPSAKSLVVKQALKAVVAIVQAESWSTSPFAHLVSDLLAVIYKWKPHITQCRWFKHLSTPNKLGCLENLG